MTDPGESPPADPLARHRVRTEEVLAGGDARAIKDLYVELGTDIWEVARGRDSYQVPVLSAPETLPQVVASLEEVRGLILDAGCGPNPAVALAISADPQRVVVVLDIGWGTVRTARLVAGAAGRELLGVAGDLENLPFRAGVFNGIVCDDTIEHLPDDRAGIGELARVLAAGGRAVLATPNRHSAAVLAAIARDRLAGRRRPRPDYFVASSHLREYTWSQFEILVGHCLEVQRRRPVGWEVGARKRLLSRILGWPGLFRLSQMIVLECGPGRSRPS